MRWTTSPSKVDLWLIRYIKLEQCLAGAIFQCISNLSMLLIKCWNQMMYSSWQLFLNSKWCQIRNSSLLYQYQLFSLLPSIKSFISTPLHPLVVHRLQNVVLTFDCADSFGQSFIDSPSAANLHPRDTTTLSSTGGRIQILVHTRFVRKTRPLTHLYLLFTSNSRIKVIKQIAKKSRRWTTVYVAPSSLFIGN